MLNILSSQSFRVDIVRNSVASVQWVRNWLTTNSTLNPATIIFVELPILTEDARITMSFASCNLIRSLCCISVKHFVKTIHLHGLPRQVCKHLHGAVLKPFRLHTGPASGTFVRTALAQATLVAAKILPPCHRLWDVLPNCTL